MNKTEQEWKNRMQSWRIAAPDAGLADRIAARAVALPQRQPLGFWFRQALISGFSEWQFGLNYKLASLLLCAAVGFGAGFYQITDTINVEVSGIAFGEDELGGDL